MLSTIEKLCDLRGVSGDEEEVRAWLIERIKRIRPACEYHVDAAGSLIVHKPGRRPAKHRVMLDAHIDEVGFIVRHIDEVGTLKFTAVGGIDSRVVMGKPVLVGPGRVFGVVGAKALHQLEAAEREAPPKLERLYIDIGAESREEALKLVSLGDTVVFDSDFTEFGEGFIKAKALDDRAGCAVLLKLLEEETETELWVSFSTKEEIGLVGARCAAFGVDPEMAIVVETTTAADVAGVAAEDQVCHLGKGPVVSFMDHASIYDRELFKLALTVADEQDIPAQVKQGTSGGNNAGSIGPARSGVRCAGISMPCRYLHSPSCVLNTSDIENTYRLVKALAERMAAL